jgi:hypothetical protein
MPAAAKPRKAATTAPARTKALAKAPVAAAKRKMPAKPKKG